MSRRLILAALAAAAVAPAFAPDRCPAPVEVEPNDDPSDEGYAGQVTLPSLPFLHEIQGTLSGGADVDVFELSSGATSRAVVVMEGFTGAPFLQATHSVSAPGDQVARSFPYGLRVVTGWSLFPTQDERPNFVGVVDGALEEADDYSLRVAAPAGSVSRVSAKGVFKATPGKDTCKVRLDYDPVVPLGPGATEVRVYLRDYAESIPAASFVPSKAGTKFTYKSKAGIRKLTWDAKKGIVSIAAKGFDFGAEPVDGSFPIAVLSDRGGLASDADGVLKAGKASTRITVKVK